MTQAFVRKRWKIIVVVTRSAPNAMPGGVSGAFVRRNERRGTVVLH